MTYGKKVIITYVIVTVAILVTVYCFIPAKKKHTIEVTYRNGDKETFTHYSRYPGALKNGCLLYPQSSYAITCDVRSIKIIKTN